MAEPESGRSGQFWTSLPGILTAVAALITAIGGLVATLVAVGVIGAARPSAAAAETNPNSSPSESASVAPSESASVAPSESASVAPSAGVDEWALKKAADMEALGIQVGDPIGVTLGTTDGRARVQGFGYVLIYRMTSGDVVAIRGAIREKWIALGGGVAPVGELGYPVADEQTDQNKLPYQDFETGALVCAPANLVPRSCAYEVYKGVYDLWRKFAVGYPLFDVDEIGGALAGQFSNGTVGAVIYVSAASSVVCSGDPPRVLYASPSVTDCLSVWTAVTTHFQGGG